MKTNNRIEKRLKIVKNYKKNKFVANNNKLKIIIFCKRVRINFNKNVIKKTDKKEVFITGV